MTEDCWRCKHLINHPWYANAWMCTATPPQHNMFKKYCGKLMIKEGG